jgi:hypothetical protein
MATRSRISPFVANRPQRASCVRYGRNANRAIRILPAMVFFAFLELMLDLGMTATYLPDTV